MSSAAFVPLPASNGGVLTDVLVNTANAVRKTVAVRVTSTVVPSLRPATSGDLEAAFVEWAEESLEWSRSTFDAQSETWPAD
jgi:hypothetical protein